MLSLFYVHFYAYFLKVCHFILTCLQFNYESIKKYIFIILINISFGKIYTVDSNGPHSALQTVSVYKNHNERKKKLGQR